MMAGCVSTTTSQMTYGISQNSETGIQNPVDSIMFQNPIVNFCREKDNNLLVLDASFEKIFRVDIAKRVISETISIPQKINFLKGIASDNVYIYLYTENSLYRFDPINQKLSLLVDENRIKIFDLSVNRLGEVFLSDNLNNQIIIINNIGTIEQFDKPHKDLFFPAGIYYDERSQHLWVINRAQKRIERYSRIGNIDSIISIPNQFCYKLKISQNRIFLLQNKLKNIIEIDSNRIVYTSNYTISDFLLTNDNLFFLDANRMIYIYKSQL
jgi:hypothetical protein